jgi:hypothetical protein
VPGSAPSTAARTTSIFREGIFVNAFISVTNPVFAYAGHFMFSILISEMRNPKDAMKAPYILQGFATTYYVVLRGRSGFMITII